MKKYAILNSPRLQELKKKRYKILKNKILFIVFLFILFLISLSLFYRWEKININTIKIIGNKVTETQMIEEVVREKIAGNYLYFLPKTNFLFYPKKEIENELIFKFNRLKDISFNVKNFRTLNISLSERIALYTYCGLTLPESNKYSIESLNEEKCYFMDEDGYIFDEAPYFSGEIYLKFYGIKNNSYFFQPNFKKLISFKEILEKLEIKPVVFFIQNNGDIEMFLSSFGASSMGPKIIFKADTDLNQIIQNLQSILTTEPFKSDFKNKYSSLLYIDLRFGNKVFYKFK